MRLLKILLPLFALLLGSAPAGAQNGGGTEFNPTSPEEPSTPKETGILYLVVNPAAGGTINRESGVKYEVGQTVSLSTTANGGYQFVNWTKGGDEISTSKSFSYTIEAGEQTLTANYVYNPGNPSEPESPVLKHALTLQTNIPGAASNLYGAGRYDSGETVHIYGTANNFYTFVNWTDDEGTTVSETFDFRYTVPDRDVTLTANFTYDFNPSNPEEPGEAVFSRRLTLKSDPEGGASSLYGGGSYASGETVHVYGNANSYYTFVNWTDDEGVTVSDTFDFRYTMPERNVTLTAHFSYGFNPESPREPESSDIPESLYAARPRISLYDDEHVMMLCETLGATIHYTLDDSTPTFESTVYEGPVELPGNVTVKAIATKEGLIDSPVGTLEVTHFILAVPTATYQNRHLVLESETAGATFRYTKDGSEPTAESTLYTGPIALSEDCTVRYIAQKPKYVDSEEGSFEFVYADYMTLPAKASYGRQHLTLSCEDTSAAIRYSIDDEPLTEESSLYEAPIHLTETCTVHFMAVAPGLYPSEAGIHEFAMEDWQETGAVLATDYANRRISVSHAGGLPAKVDIDGSAETLETPCTIEVAPGMKSLSVTIPATTEDRYDSETEVRELVFHSKPEYKYDGNAVHIAQAADEPKPDKAEAWIQFNGSSIQEGGPNMDVKVEDFGRFDVCLKSNDAFRSDTLSIMIDFFNTGKTVGVRDGHRIEETFGTWGDAEEDYSYLGLTGSVNADDLKFAATLPSLSVLRLDEGCLEEGDYDGALQGSGIETVSSFSFPKGLLKGMPRLTNVVMESNASPLPDGILEEVGNPNLLLWVADNNLAPADFTNTVVYEPVGGNSPVDPDTEGISGTASRISLQAGYPFGAVRPLHAERIEVVKEFTQATQLKVCQGWESIVLPFTPDSVTHEREGRIVPFAAWDSDIKGPRPFWLYSPTTESWNAETRIEALKPYIIQMPNNPDYVEAFNLNGKVTFVADGVDLDPASMVPEAMEWTGGSKFEGTFMPVEEAGLRSLNVNGDGGFLPGSCFIDEASTLPFGAYVRDSGSAKAIPVFGDLSEASVPTLAGGGLSVDSPRAGALRVSSAVDRHVDIVSATGIRIRSLEVSAGETVTVDGLAADLYIAAGVKIIVK